MTSLRVFLAFLLLLAGTLLAAESTSKPALLPIVDVTPTTGAPLHGRLLSSDFDGITVEPTTGDKTPHTFAWKDIKRVSNGLTRQKVVDQWKAAHKDELCDTCKGDRTVTCPTCKGTGHDLSKRTDCPACHGAGTVACAAPKCVKGQIPCPGPCLKLSVGQWVKKPDGLRWQQIPYVTGGYYQISEHHLGEVMEMKNGLTNGNRSTCPICGGKATVDCPQCHGTGIGPCPDCIKSTSPACPDHCNAGSIPCKTCNGTGLKPKEGTAP